SSWLWVLSRWIGAGGGVLSSGTPLGHPTRDHRRGGVIYIYYIYRGHHSGSRVGWPSGVHEDKTPPPAPIHREKLKSKRKEKKSRFDFFKSSRGAVEHSTNNLISFEFGGSG